MRNFHTIEEIVLQHSTRNMDKIQAHFPNEHTKNAVQAFLKLDKGVVFIYTGFYVAGYAETDGPLGAYFLAKAFEKLGYTPVIITDSFCEDYFFDIKTLYIPIEGLENQGYKILLDTYKPVAHLSIERCGQNHEGLYLNSRGVDIKEFTAPVDELFKLGSQTAPSFGIGDGGNEVGMGSFAAVLKNKELFYDYCVIPCDYPMIASVSNWGGYGFIAELERVLHVNVLPSFEELEQYLAFIVSKGSVDGIKRESVMSVDGKEWAIEPEILQALKDYATKG
ncbi:DUF4392 domain-containing protein [Sulfurospirillum diekertiae]|jgi:hypothetical protein|uniref:DUF4392 domain-containing protein n=1 Tax=Sulfurospirillum diekertiae TaxID=1854492 RepID=A0A290HBD7_9BACT|nr:DUF4392 domain-containing protein [Sulfurospirillum diekertiae]ATB68541.1 hypothetical protein SJPD1_0413 [Sulfurospirillum diekertiae]QIR76385.1 DUF4392 domain-containing protein [Sulfurospirillum diekertiae]QIR79014.1 DUF4392 domain-containing protein [Sulfurospirillum diekertiae]